MAKGPSESTRGREEVGAAVIEPQRAEREVGVRTRQQAVVAELGKRALEGRDLSTLLDEAVAVVAETLGVEYAKVLELLPDGKALLLRSGMGWKEGLVGQARVSSGADSQAGYTLLSQHPVIVGDLRSEKRFSGPPLLREHGVVSGVSVIIPGPRQPFGVLGAHTRRLRKFTKDDAHFMQAVANVLAAAIAGNQAEEAVAKTEQRQPAPAIVISQNVRATDARRKVEDERISRVRRE